MSWVEQICIRIYSRRGAWLALQIKVYIAWRGIRCCEHTGNAVESVAKSTTSGSSSNMLFSIMFLGRLARSNIQRVRENRQIRFKIGEMREREKESKGFKALVGTHSTQYVNICAVFWDFQSSAQKNSSKFWRQGIFNIKT